MKILTMVTTGFLALGILAGCDTDHDKHKKVETETVNGTTVKKTEESKVDRNTGEGYQKTEVKVDKTNP